MATATETKKAAGKPIGKAGINEVAKSQELKDLGWRTESLDSGFWAYEINGDRRIGPAASMAALHTMVTLASGKPAANGKGKGNEKSPPEKFRSLDAETLGLKTDETPSTRLPGMEEPAIEDLDRQADICVEAKEKRDQAKTAFDDACDVMRQKMHEYDRKRYNRRGFSLVIEDSEKLVIKKAEQAPAKNPKTDKTIKL